MTIALVFPGQGSQAVGMGKALAVAFAPARQVFDDVDAALGERLSETIWSGPADTLTLTENAQPALMAISIAALRVLEQEAGLDVGRGVAFVAGHSLGEYSALAAARAISVVDAARLLRTRGRAMQKAVPVGVGAMAALIGIELEEARAIAAEASSAGVCAAANDNGGGLMQPAADVMAEALAKVSVQAPLVPVVANVPARPIKEPAEIVKNLVEQITATVRWRESVLFMARSGVSSFFEVGAGRVLSGLIKRIAETASATPIGLPEDIAKFKASRA